MFNVHNAPVTPRELERFVSAVIDDIDSLPRDPSGMTLAVDDLNGIKLLSSRDATHPSTLSHIDQLLASRRRMVALVSVTGWLPDDGVPVAAAWVVIAVGRGGNPASVAVRRLVEDEQWTEIPTEQLPWFALSTAAGLRAAIEHGTPLRFKHASSTELYRRPDECPDPPVDERGEL